MLTSVWGVPVFHVVKLRPTGGTHNASYYSDEPLCEIACRREAQRGSTNRKSVVHAANARPESARRTVRYIEACGMVRASHPPYSPDLAPSDFFLFGCFKIMLQR
jgi:histone-lysine N-methyltransferase SETMAR